MHSWLASSVPSISQMYGTSGSIRPSELSRTDCCLLCFPPSGDLIEVGAADQVYHNSNEITGEGAAGPHSAPPGQSALHTLWPSCRHHWSQCCCSSGCCCAAANPPPQVVSAVQGAVLGHRHRQEHCSYLGQMCSCSHLLILAVSLLPYLALLSKVICMSYRVVVTRSCTKCHATILLSASDILCVHWTVCCTT